MKVVELSNTVNVASLGISFYFHNRATRVNLPVTAKVAPIASDANLKFVVLEDPLQSDYTEGKVDSVTLNDSAVDSN